MFHGRYFPLDASYGATVTILQACALSLATDEGINEETNKVGITKKDSVLDEG